MTTAEYAVWRREKTPHFLLDIRQPEEFETAKIEGAVLIPLAELPGRLSELPKDIPLVVMCHHGMRSGQRCPICAKRAMTPSICRVGSMPGPVKLTGKFKFTYK